MTVPFTAKIKHFIAILALIAADQLSKWAVMEHIIRRNLEQDYASVGFFPWLIEAPDLLDFTRIPVLPFFNIVMVWNKGISFGLFNQPTNYGPYILMALAIIIIGIFFVWLMKRNHPLQDLGIILVIAGALGNLIDRLRFGAVVDFLDFHAFGYHWPAFNIADACICVGVFVLILHSLFFEKELQSKP